MDLTCAIWNEKTPETIEVEDKGQKTLIEYRRTVGRGSVNSVFLLESLPQQVLQLNNILIWLFKIRWAIAFHLQNGDGDCVM